MEGTERMEASAMTGQARRPDTSVEMRLRWWAVALPAAAFAALLTLLLTGTGGESDAAGHRQPYLQLIEQVRDTWIP
jgi:hypothetical protein